MVKSALSKLLNVFGLKNKEKHQENLKLQEKEVIGKTQMQENCVWNCEGGDCTGEK